MLTVMIIRPDYLCHLRYLDLITCVMCNEDVVQMLLLKKYVKNYTGSIKKI